MEDITSLTVAEEKKKKEIAKRKKAAARKKPLDKNSAVPSLNHMSLPTREIYEEFENQGYKVTFNPPGNAKCQFFTVARHLQNTGILRSPETLRDEVCMTVPQLECLDMISSSGENHATHIVPQVSEPVATFAFGHFSEDHGMHYASLTETYSHHIRDETENDQDHACGMSETNENFTDQ